MDCVPSLTVNLKINPMDSGPNRTDDGGNVTETLYQPRYIFATLLIPISMVGTFGNASVMFVTFYVKSLRNISHVLIAIIALLDLVICGYFLPVCILELLAVLNNRHICFFTSFLSPILTVLSTQVQGILAYVRYKLTTCQGHLSAYFNKVLYGMLIGCFLLNIILYISFVTPSGPTKYDPSVGLCSRRRPVFRGQPVLFIVFFFSGVLLTFVSYVRIIQYIARHSYSESLKQTRRNRLTVLLFWLFVFWSLGYTFVIVIRFVDRKRKWPAMVYQCAYYGLWCNSCANPIVYNFMSKEFSEAYKSTILGICKGFRARLNYGNVSDVHSSSGQQELTILE